MKKCASSSYVDLDSIVMSDLEDEKDIKSFM